MDWLTLLPRCGAPVYVAGKDSGDMLNLPHVYELSEHVNRWLETAADREAPVTTSATVTLAAAK